MAMVDPEEYLAQVLEDLTPLEPVEVALHQAHGRVLAEDVTALLPVPPWTSSAMDGYAVRACDTAGASPCSPVRLPVVGDVPAGTAPAPLEAGAAQRIMTGAVLPEGADAVVRVEDTDQVPGAHPLPEVVEIRSAPVTGANVRQAGEDVAAGAPVLAAGSVLSAAGVSALASVGLGRVRVVPQVRVAVVSTGAELCDVGQDLPPGAVPDSNGMLLAGLVAEHGARCTQVARSGDDAEELVGHLCRLAREADLVVTSGGVSAGAFDPLSALDDAEAGRSGPGPGSPDTAPSHPEADPVLGCPGAAPVRLRRSAVAMQPGKPQGHGWIRSEDGREVPLVCLPGNPVSVLVSFTTLVVPVLARLGGYGSPGSTGAGPGRALPVLTAPQAATLGTPGPGTSSPGSPGPGAGSLAPGQEAPARGDAPAVVPGQQPATGLVGIPARARSAVGWAAPPGRRQYVPVRLVAPPSPLPPGAGGQAGTCQRQDSAREAAGQAWVAPTHRLGSGSHLVASLPAAQALAVVGADVAEVVAGEELEILALPVPPAPVRAVPSWGRGGAEASGRRPASRSPSPGDHDRADVAEARGTATAAPHRGRGRADRVSAAPPPGGSPAPRTGACSPRDAQDTRDAPAAARADEAQHPQDPQHAQGPRSAPDGEGASGSQGTPGSQQVLLTHLDESGAARMVDVTGKAPSVRQARATALVSCSAAVVEALRGGTVPKGDVLAVARVAGIAAAKKTPDLLPLAHVIGVHGCQVDLEVTDSGVRVEATVRTAGRTGVEMEALTAVTVAGLAVVDMVKGVDRDVALRAAQVVAKSGGRSGDWIRPAAPGGAAGTAADAPGAGAP